MCPLHSFLCTQTLSYVCFFYPSPSYRNLIFVHTIFLVGNGGPTVKPSAPPTLVPTATPKKPTITLAPTPSPTISATLYPTLTPSKTPTVMPSYQIQDCRASCSLHTSQVVTIAANNHIDDVYLSPTFSLAFTMNYQSLAANNTSRRSILELINANDQTSLFTISATETAQPRITYGNNVLAEYGPAFNPSYAAGGWTTYTLKVYPDRVTLTSSVNVNDVRTYYIASPVDTTNKLYKLYASGPQGVSAGGYIYYILISGTFLILKFFLYKLFLAAAAYLWIACFCIKLEKCVTFSIDIYLRDVILPLLFCRANSHTNRAAHLVTYTTTLSQP